MKRSERGKYEGKTRLMLGRSRHVAMNVLKFWSVDTGGFLVLVAEREGLWKMKKCVRETVLWSKACCLRHDVLLEVWFLR